MHKEELLALWKQEEAIAHIQGWDFSHLRGRYEEEQDLPWDYEQLVHSYLKKEDHLLDMDTGGGEFLLTLHHPYTKTWCSEGYEPNFELIQQTLAPLGIHVTKAQANALPYQDEQFDIIINRHGDLEPDEVYRLLKPNGIFITEQVGKDNDRDLVTMLMQDVPLSFPKQQLAYRIKEMETIGFEILQRQEAYRPIRFYDVGALVWFAHIIEWEFPNFSVDAYLPQLYQLQKQIEEHGEIQGTIHRFMIVASKRQS